MAEVLNSEFESYKEDYSELVESMDVDSLIELRGQIKYNYLDEYNDLYETINKELIRRVLNERND